MTGPEVSHTFAPNQGTVLLERTVDSDLLVRLGGKWQLRRDLPSISVVDTQLRSQPSPKRLVFDASRLTGWDSGLISFLIALDQLCSERGIEPDRTGLPSGVRRLLELAEAVPEKQGARTAQKRASLFERVGDRVVAYGAATLVGVILAFMGAVQLRQFGAAIFVADLVGIGMLREMGAMMMTGIIMSGRTGAAFAAQLGTMKVTEEIDALTTMGISPLQFLVLPRVLALVLMMPLLCLYSDLMGILGGAFVEVGMLDLSFKTYMRETIHALSLTNLVLGLIKAASMA